MRCETDQDGTRIVLSITPDYVGDWGFWEACRELLQNSIDQCATDSMSQPVFEYDEHGQSLRIGATHCHLTRDTLLLGQTSKRGDAKQIGQFGEGYKLAMLVLTRMQYEVTIENGNETWTAGIEHDDDFERVYQLANSGAPDVAHLDGNLQWSNKGEAMQQFFVERYKAENGDAVPVSSESERKRMRGSITRFVPSPFRNLLHRVHEFATVADDDMPFITLETFRSKWKHKFDGEFRRDLDRIITKSKEWAR